MLEQLVSPPDSSDSGRVDVGDDRKGFPESKVDVVYLLGTTGLVTGAAAVWTSAPEIHASVDADEEERCPSG